MNLVRSIATIGGYTIGSRIFGFVREILMARFLGASIVADAFVLALKFPSMFRKILAEGAFNAAFVPMISGILATKGKEEARHFAEEILMILLVVLFVLVGVVEIFMPEILSIVAHGFAKTPERFQLAVQFTRITFPFIFFMSLTALYSGILNSLDKFAAVASSPMIGNMVIIAIVYLMTGFGLCTHGYAFSFGVLACGIVQFLWVLIPTFKNGVVLHLSRPRLTPRVKKFFKLLGPALAGSGVVQISLLLDLLIATFLPAGGVSFIHYADRLVQLPISVLGTAVGTALLPLLSKQIRAQEYEKADKSQNLALEYSLLLTFPAMIGLILLAKPLIHVLFEHGHFSPYATVQTSYVLMALATGLPAYILIKVFSSTFFARENTFTPFIAAAIGIVTNLILALCLVRSYGHVGIGIATAVSSWINVGFLVYKLRQHKQFHLNDRIKRFIPRMLVASFFTGIAMFILRSLVEPMLLGSRSEKILALIYLVGGGIISFISLAQLVGALNFIEAKKKFKKSKFGEE